MEQLRQNARQATTEDLLNRVTVYRKGMDPEAVDVIEKELRRRGVQQDAITAHLASMATNVIWLSDGTAARCTSYDSRRTVCYQPAIGSHRAWHWFSVGGFRLIPLWYGEFYYCAKHQLTVSPGTSSRPRQ